MSDYICLIFGRDDAVLAVHSFAQPDLNEAIRNAVALTLCVRDTRGFQLWSGGKIVSSQLSKGGTSWTDAVPELAEPLTI